MRAWTVAIPTLLSVGLACAQTGIVTGRAVDSEHHPLSGARVTIQRTTDKSTQSIKTDAQGRYRFTVTPGSYSLRAEDDALQQGTAGPTTISAGTTATVDLIVKPQYFDEPAFTVAGVTDNTYRGGHGAGTVLRSSEALTKETRSLSDPNPAEQAGDSLQAVQQLQAAAESNASEPNLFNLGTELLAHRASAPAINVFSKGVRLFPQSTRMLLGLASAQYAAGSYQQAGQSFFRAADLNPADPKPYVFLTECERSEITEAAGYEERLARWAERDPENPAANYYYGVTLWTHHHDTSRALRYLQRAIAFDSHFAKAHLQLGSIASANGKQDEAIAEYRKAIAADPDLEEAHYRLSEAYRVSGDTTGAASEIAIYKRLSDESAKKLEHERRQVQQFVISLKAQ